MLAAPPTPGTADDEAYTDDRNGNRTLSGYTTGANNRITASPGFTYAYDDEGNLLTKVQLNGPGATDDLTTTYAYDHRNRLTGVTTRNASNVVVASANFRYDPLDRRIRTNLDSNGAASGGVTTTWTAYDGDHAYADFANNGSLQTRYLHGPAVDMLLARTSAAGVSAWYLTDRQGSVRDLVSTSGAVLNHVVYDAYGRVKSETNAANGDRHKYTGRETDAVTGLQYNRARYYDAVIGRWTQEDPIGYAAGDSNLYRYVDNSPPNLRDPFGLRQEPLPPMRPVDQPNEFPLNPNNAFVLSGPPYASPDEFDGHRPPTQPMDYYCGRIGIPANHFFTFSSLDDIARHIETIRRIVHAQEMQDVYIIISAHGRPGTLFIGRDGDQIVAVGPNNPRELKRLLELLRRVYLDVLPTRGGWVYFEGCNTLGRLKPRPGEAGEVEDVFSMFNCSLGVPILGNVGFCSVMGQHFLIEEGGGVQSYDRR